MTLIIGAGGFVGGALAARLVSSGRAVVAGLRNPARTLPREAESQTVNYGDPDDLRQLLLKCDRVVYVASSSTPLSTAGDPVTEMELNLRPFLSLLEVLAELHPKPLIYLSSAGALFSGEGTQPLDEAAIPSPRSYHGSGKIAAEHFVGAWCRQTGSCATIIRPSNVYGPGQLGKAGFGVIPRAFGAVYRNEPFPIRGDGQAARDYLYIEDLVDLCIHAIDQRPSAGVEVFHAGTGISTSINELLKLIEEITSQPIIRDYQGSADVDADIITVDSGRALNRFGWQPSTSLEIGLTRTWHWFRREHQ